MNYVLSFVFEFDLEDDVYFFAYWYVLSKSRFLVWVSFQSSKGLFYVLNFVLEFDLEDDAYSFAPHFP